MVFDKHRPGNYLLLKLEIALEQEHILPDMDTGEDADRIRDSERRITELEDERSNINIAKSNNNIRSNNN